MHTHHSNNRLGISANLAASIELAAKQSAMKQTRLEIGMRRGIGSGKARLGAVRGKMGMGSGSGRRLVNRKSMVEAGRVGVYGQVAAVVVEVGAREEEKGEEGDVVVKSGTDGREGDGAVGRPVTARGRRSSRFEDSDIVDSGMVKSEVMEESEILGNEPSVIEESLYDGSEVEPFDFPWSSPALKEIGTFGARTKEDIKGKGIQRDEPFTTDGEDERSQDEHADDYEQIEGETNTNLSLPEMPPQTKSKSKDIIEDRQFSTRNAEFLDCTHDLEVEDKENQSPTDSLSLSLSDSDSGTARPTELFSPEASTSPAISDTKTQIHHTPESARISIDTDWQDLDHSSDIVVTENIRRRVLPYTQQAEHLKLAALPVEIGSLLATMIRVYNGNRLPTIQSREIGLDSSEFGLVHHASILCTSLILSENQGWTSARTIIQELLSLDTATPGCHRDTDIYAALRLRSKALLEEIEAWVTRLEKVRVMLDVGSDVEGWAEGDVERLDGHRRWVRRVRVEVLVVQCAVEVRFGGVGWMLRRNETKKGDAGEDGDDCGEVCVSCESALKHSERAVDDNSEKGFLLEELPAILGELRREGT